MIGTDPDSSAINAAECAGINETCIAQQSSRSECAVTQERPAIGRTKDPLLTLEEISDVTHMPLATLRYKRHRGELPFIFKLGRRLVAYQSELDEWIDDQRRATRRT